MLTDSELVHLPGCGSDGCISCLAGSQGPCTRCMTPASGAIQARRQPHRRKLWDSQRLAQVVFDKKFWTFGATKFRGCLGSTIGIKIRPELHFPAHPHHAALNTRTSRAG
jgi:hypothetical protein